MNIIREISTTTLLAATVIAAPNTSAAMARANPNSFSQAEIDSILSDSTMLSEVVVKGKSSGKMRGRIENVEFIGMGELKKAACCNLGESFTTNPSVDVSYSDAATGAKQIRLLGLSGRYVQMLSENIPNYRGAAMPYALGYVPGPWMQSIQVSKGASSVKNGYEAIAGQINIEFLKPQSEQQLLANLFLDSKLRYEVNAVANAHITDRLSTSILAHYEDRQSAHDGNGDGFMDMPKLRQWNVQNRWAWMGDRYIFQAGIKAMRDSRNGGQAHDAAMSADHGLYRIASTADRYEAFMKNAVILDPDHGTNIALMLTGSIHNQDATYGLRNYAVNEKNGYASLLFETDFTEQHKLSAGLSLNHDYFDESLNILNNTGTSSETVYGAYAQYTLALNQQFTLMAGLRADHSNRYGSFVTPRANIRWSPSEVITLRASAGKGYRAPHVLAENNYLLASSRGFDIAPDLKMEEAWNYGASAALHIPIGDKTLDVNAEYYFTDFINQTVIDMDSDPHKVSFYNLNGKSYSHTMQIDASWEFFSGFSATAAYRLTHVRQTIGDALREVPFTNSYKGLLTLSYVTPLELWHFDATLQLNGGGRLPDSYVRAGGNRSWSNSFDTFPMLNLQITRDFRHFSIYVGGENLTNFKQKNPIVGGDNPWSNEFDSTIVWGPIDGAMFYAGVRFNLNY